MDTLPERIVERLCRPGEGEQTCSFLAMMASSYFCTKGTSIEAVIHERRADGTLGAKGDNCSGPPDFRRNGS